MCSNYRFIGFNPFNNTEDGLISVVYISRSANILAEAAVLVLTWRTSYQTWLATRKSGRQASLPDILCENGKFIAI